MLAQLFCFIQRILPQIFLSRLIGKLADCEIFWVKNLFISIFCFFYKIEWDEAVRKNAKDYHSFNDFFTRKLEPNKRLITLNSSHLLSPADGCVAAFGEVKDSLILQAKNRFFSIDDLLAQNSRGAHDFFQGFYSTIYLAPHNYHRVHMPISGKLIQTTHVAGHLFSVNQMTSENIPNLYAQNERIICLFETEFGKMAIILVGAMIVGSIQLSWQSTQPHPINTRILPEQLIVLNQGDEIGHFKLGSTVVMLLEKSNLEWDSTIHLKKTVRTGDVIARKR